MPIISVICYLCTLMFYTMGYLKVLELNAGHVSTRVSTTYVSQATSYFVLTIFFALYGSLLFYVKTIKDKEIKIMTPNLDLKHPKKTDIRRRAS
ncbi:hypothetical protein [Desulfosporosinus meridiei]|uniref:hypothetical protein n=1 Tax=Desulfosporosinus meridiei TaxID=79209 RepID=UPI001FA6E75D|nr:hypothetical protein [Desulfosporosinus meridiei]